jgi:hypothetical protein
MSWDSENNINKTKCTIILHCTKNKE